MFTEVTFSNMLQCLTLIFAPEEFTFTILSHNLDNKEKTLETEAEGTN